MTRPTKKTAANGNGKPSPVKDISNQLTVYSEPDESIEKVVAKVAMSPVTGNAGTVVKFSVGNFGKVSLEESVAILKTQVDEVKAGNLAYVESMLVSQAAALNAVFVEMSRRASLNMGEYLQATEVYMRVALKAQSQCRTTLETLAEIKNPRAAVAFVKQANITSGPQQVNNGTASPPDTRAREINNQPSELLPGDINGQRMDTRTKETTGAANQELEAVGQVNGAEIPRR